MWFLCYNIGYTKVWMYGRESMYTKFVMTNPFTNGKEEDINGHTKVMETTPNKGAKFWSSYPCVHTTLLRSVLTTESEESFGFPI